MSFRRTLTLMLVVLMALAAITIVSTPASAAYCSFNLGNNGGHYECWAGGYGTGASPSACYGELGDVVFTCGHELIDCSGDSRTSAGCTWA